MKPVHKNWERWLWFSNAKVPTEDDRTYKNRETLPTERSKLNLIPTLMK